MGRRFILYLAFVFLVSNYGCRPDNAEKRSITDEVLRDKIAGGWAGKMIGASIGKSTNADELWKPSDLYASLTEDELYVQLGFLMAMDQYGPEVSAKKIQEVIARAEFPLWHANAQARKNYFDSIFPPHSGFPENNAHADDSDFQNEANVLGFMCPGMPQAAVEQARKTGQITSYGDGIYGGIFFAALYSEAFFENDLQKLVEKALGCIPAESDFSKTVRDVLFLFGHYKTDWETARSEFDRKWASTDICHAGSVYNNDAKLNGAYTILGLLYGGGNPERTAAITTLLGQDRVGNVSNALALLGVINGFTALPNEYRESVFAIRDSVFPHTNYSFQKAVESTKKYADGIIQKNGGSKVNSGYEIVSRTVRPGRMEVSFPDVSFQRRISVFAGNNWEFKGNWQIRKKSESENAYQSMYSSTAGDEAIFRFDGSGVFIAVNWFKDGGKADVYLDGTYLKTIDSYYYYGGQQLTGMNLYIGNLREGEHTIRIIVKGEKRPESEGTNIYLSEAVVFKFVPKVNRYFKFQLK